MHRAVRIIDFFITHTLNQKEQASLFTDTLYTSLKEMSINILRVALNSFVFPLSLRPKAGIAQSGSVSP